MEQCLGHRPKVKFKSLSNIPSNVPIPTIVISHFYVTCPRLFAILACPYYVYVPCYFWSRIDYFLDVYMPLTCLSTIDNPKELSSVIAISANRIRNPHLLIMFIV
jgi:hypothetical protein